VGDLILYASSLRTETATGAGVLEDMRVATRQPSDQLTRAGVENHGHRLRTLADVRAPTRALVAGASAAAAALCSACGGIGPLGPSGVETWPAMPG